MCMGCSESAPALGNPDVSAPDSTNDVSIDPAVADDSSNIAPTVPQVEVQLGPRDRVPFQPWGPDSEVQIIFGPQGAFHTEHAALATNASQRELHLAVVRASVERDGVPIAPEAAWEWWEEDWQPDGDGLRVELPPLVFDDMPSDGPAMLHTRIELQDGRSHATSVTINLLPLQ